MSADKMPPLPYARNLRILHAGIDPGPPYIVTGYKADQMHAYAREYAAVQCAPLLEALRRAEYSLGRFTSGEDCTDLDFEVVDDVGAALAAHKDQA